jgi:DUF2924 family protein
LKRVAKDSASGRPLKLAATRTIEPGSLLLRRWRGVLHEVKVVEGGFHYRNQHYRSLSEIARLITGTRWSGPLFFGLKRRPKEVIGNGAE